MNSWTEVQLGDVCTFHYGKALPSSQRDGGAFPVYGSNGIVGLHSQAITQGPTIVVGRKGSLGEVNYSEGACWPIDTTYYIDSSSTNADLRWLRYRLEGLGLPALNRAAAIPGLNRQDAYQKRLLLPPLAEQRQIAAILDQADALRAKRRGSLALLDDLIQAAFLSTFGEPSTWPDLWPMGTIGDTVDSVTYGSSAKAGAVGEWPILRMGNLTTTGRLDLHDLKYLDLSEKDVPKHTVRRGDLLFNRTNSPELVGKSAVVRTDVPFAYAGYLIRLRTTEQHTTEYLSGYLNSRHGKAVLRGMNKAIIGQANINAKELQAIRIALPPLALQQSWSKQVAAIEAQRSHHEAGLTVIDELFASLQSRAFSGGPTEADS